MNIKSVAKEYLDNLIGKKIKSARKDYDEAFSLLQDYGNSQKAIGKRITPEDINNYLSKSLEDFHKAKKSRNKALVATGIAGTVGLGTGIGIPVAVHNSNKDASELVDTMYKQAMDLRDVVDIDELTMYDYKNTPPKSIANSLVNNINNYILQEGESKYRDRLIEEKANLYKAFGDENASNKINEYMKNKDYNSILSYNPKISDSNAKKGLRDFVNKETKFDDALCDMSIENRTKYEKHPRLYRISPAAKMALGGTLLGASLGGFGGLTKGNGAKSIAIRSGIGAGIGGLLGGALGYGASTPPMESKHYIQKKLENQQIRDQYKDASEVVSAIYKQAGFISTARNALKKKTSPVSSVTNKLDELNSAMVSRMKAIDKLEPVSKKSGTSQLIQDRINGIRNKVTV